MFDQQGDLLCLHTIGWALEPLLIMPSPVPGQTPKGSDADVSLIEAISTKDTAKPTNIHKLALITTLPCTVTAVTATFPHACNLPWHPH